MIKVRVRLMSPSALHEVGLLGASIGQRYLRALFASFLRQTICGESRRGEGGERTDEARPPAAAAHGHGAAFPSLVSSPFGRTVFAGLRFVFDLAVKVVVIDDLRTLTLKKWQTSRRSIPKPSGASPEGIDQNSADPLALRAL